MITHTVPSDVFDALARGEGDMRGVLRAGQRSKRLLLVHEVIATARSRAPKACEEARIAEAFALLVDLQRRAREPVDAVLMQPGVGAWATSCLRSLLVDGSIEPDDLGHLGAIVAAAALRAGEAVEVTAFVREGSVMLPTYGLAGLDTKQGLCRLRTRPGGGGYDGGEIEIDVDGVRTEAVWLPVRHLRTVADGVAIDIRLDDVDPFRRCDQLAVTPRLGAAAVDGWQEQLDEAWAVLVRDHRAQAEAIAAGVDSIVPLLSTAAATELSATCHEAIGAVAMTPPRKPLSLALALVHEFQHTKLSALLDLVPLVDGSRRTLFYAPWRADPRPLRGLLQGTYAFLGLTAFWGQHRVRMDDDWAEFEFAFGRYQVGQALDTLQSSGQLRAAGVRFVGGMRRKLRELGALHVRSLARELARLACRDHVAGWRLRNVQPDPHLVDAWVEAWLAGRDCEMHPDPAERLVDGGGPAPSHARAALLRQRLAFPTRWRADAGMATPADILVVDGNPDLAGAAYRAQIAADPDDLASWAGMALVHDTPRSALAQRPERVYALHRAIRERGAPAPDPVELGAWLRQASW